MDVQIAIDPLTGPEIAALLREHPARALYGRFGFAPCAPFAHYIEDPCSAFLSRALPGQPNGTD